MLTHRNIFANVLQSEAFMHRSLERGGSRYLVVIPYLHIYAFSVGMMMGLWTGATQLLLPKYEVEWVLLAIRDFRPTYFPAVPTIFVSLLSHPKVTEFGLEKVRIFNSGGAPCPVDVIERFERTIGRPLYEGYGLSESSPVTHTTPQLARRKPGTIGVAVQRYRREDRRHRDRPDAAGRRDGRIVHLRPAGDARLLESAARNRRDAPH